MLTLVLFNSLIKIFFPLSFIYSFTMNVNSAFKPIYLMTQYCYCDLTRRRKSHASNFIINNTLTISLRLMAATRFGQYLAFYKGSLIKISSQVTYDYTANPKLFSWCQFSCSTQYIMASIKETPPLLHPPCINKAPSLCSWALLSCCAEQLNKHFFKSKLKSNQCQQGGGHFTESSANQGSGCTPGLWCLIKHLRDNSWLHLLILNL